MASATDLSDTLRSHAQESQRTAICARSAEDKATWSHLAKRWLGHHYIFGEHKPGHTDIWAAYEKARAKLPEAGAARGIGTPEQLRAHLKSFEDSGVDQVAFIQQGGKNRHEHICQSLELFARKVLPEFDDREEARAKQKQEELAHFIEQATTRKEKIAPLPEDKIPSFVALGRQVAVNAPQLTPEQEAARRRILAAAQIPLENPEKTPAASNGYHPTSP
jgi:hypothetical protein